MLLQQLLPNINYSNLSLQNVQQIIIDEALVLSNIVISSNNTTISFTSNKYINELTKYYYPSMYDEYEMPISEFKEWLENKNRVRLNCFLTVDLNNDEPDVTYTLYQADSMSKIEYILNTKG